MASCEKCWRDAGGDPVRYDDLVKARTGTEFECSPEQQAGGVDAKLCSVCKRNTVHCVLGRCVNPACLHITPPANVIQCDCATWGRDNNGAILYLKHHPNCDQYRPEPEIRELLQRLVAGIESWASDEDGVHPDCWEAYVKSCGVCGEWNRPRDRDTGRNDTQDTGGES